MNKKTIIIGSVLWALVCAVVIGLVIQNSSKTKDQVSGLGTWQEQYDLGVRYLSEGNYEEAILAFEAAISIDPKQQDAYLRLADVFILMMDTEKAVDILNQGFIMTENTVFQTYLDTSETISEESIGYNEYGAIEFASRDNYIEFSEIAPEKQELIDGICNAVIENEQDTLYELLESLPADFGIGEHYIGDQYTQWNEYKVWLDIRPYSLQNDGDVTGQIMVEIRPENGMGYFCDLYHTYAQDTSGREHWFEYNYSSLMGSCPCEEWQWNGAILIIDNDNLLWCNSDGVTHMEERQSIESGTMGASVRTGKFESVTNVWSEWSYEAPTESTIVTTALYENGRCIEWNGEKPQHSGSKAYLSGGYYDNSLEHIYW